MYKPYTAVSLLESAVSHFRVQHVKYKVLFSPQPFSPQPLTKLASWRSDQNQSRRATPLHTLASKIGIRAKKGWNGSEERKHIDIMEHGLEPAE